MIYINSVKAIIDEWDPIDLLCHAPDDEYQFEIARIEYLSKMTISTDALAQEIYNTFHESFGDNIFHNTYAECLLIAQKILSQ